MGCAAGVTASPIMAAILPVNPLQEPNKGAEPYCWRTSLQPNCKVSIWSDEDCTWKAGVVKERTQNGTITISLHDASKQIQVPVISENMLPTMADRGMTFNHFEALLGMMKELIGKGELKDPRSRNGDPLDLESAPTWLVVNLIVKPRSAKTPVPFVEHLSTLFPELGGPRPAKIFFSHSWESQFMDLYRAWTDLIASSGVDRDDAGWICCFALTQSDRKLELLDNNEVFAEALQLASYHVLVCNPQMEALTRMWVLFEVLRSVEFKKTITLAPMPALLQAKGQRCSIQMSRAGCSRKDDKAYIQGQMAKVGVEAMNSKIRQALREALAAGIKMEREAGNVYGVLQLKVHLARVLLEQGDFSKASETCKEVLEDMSQRQLEDSATISEINGILGESSLRRGDAKAADAYFKESISLCELHTLAMRHKHFDALLLQARYKDAKAEIETISSLTMSHDGGEGTEIGALANIKMGQVLSHFAFEHVVALERFRRAVDTLVQLKGEDAVDTAMAVWNLAHAVRRAHRPLEALELYRWVRNIQIASLDPSHMDVLDTDLNIGIALSQLGRFREAETYLSSLRKYLPAEHPKVAIATVYLSNILRLGRDLPGSEAAVDEALRVYAGMNNYAEHNELAWARTSKAHVAAALGRIEEARNLLHEAKHINASFFGVEHFLVAQSLCSLGNLLRQADEWAQAEQTYKEAEAIFSSIESDAGTVWVRRSLDLNCTRSKAILPDPSEALVQVNLCSSHGEQEDQAPSTNVEKEQSVELRQILDAAVAPATCPNWESVYSSFLDTYRESLEARIDRSP